MPQVECVPKQKTYPCGEFDDHRDREHRARQAIGERGAEPGQAAERHGAA